MINFDAVDFSERRPEEVISFFWRPVYIFNSLCIPVTEKKKSTFQKQISDDNNLHEEHKKGI